MDKNCFIKDVADVLEIDDLSTISMDTVFRELDEWSSLSGLGIICLFKEKYKYDLTVSELKSKHLISDLYALIE